MASFERKCKTCGGIGDREDQDGGMERCPDCAGTGQVRKAVNIKISVRVDNRPPQPFVMTVHPDGTLDFRPQGKRSKVSTHVQNVFNLARKESAAQEIKEQRSRKTVSRGLLTLEREARNRQ